MYPTARLSLRGSAPRFHHQWVPDTLFVEPETAPETIAGLRRRGHEVEVGKRRWSAAQAIVVDPETGTHQGGADPRKDSLAVGYNP